MYQYFDSLRRLSSSDIAYLPDVQNVGFGKQINATVLCVERMAPDDLLKRTSADAQMRRGFLEREDAAEWTAVIRSLRCFQIVLRNEKTALAERPNASDRV